MKCVNCGNTLLTIDERCGKCDMLVIHCDACKFLISENDVFCSNCGYNVEKVIERVKKENEKKLKEFLQQEKLKKQEDEMKLYADNLIVECEGNKFKAIKLFKEKYNVENDIATNYINIAFSKIDNGNINKNANNNSQLDSVEEIINKHKNDKIGAIKELKEKYNYDLITAKELVDNVISEEEVTNVNPKAIKKTIIVANSSSKKATSAIGRGLVGGALLGPIGLLAGTTAKTKDKTTFLVIYNNGKQETVTVKNNGWMFKEYCKYLEK